MYQMGHQAGLMSIHPVSDRTSRAQDAKTTRRHDDAINRRGRGSDGLSIPNRLLAGLRFASFGDRSHSSRSEADRYEPALLTASMRERLFYGASRG